MSNIAIILLVTAATSGLVLAIALLAISRLRAERTRIESALGSSAGASIEETTAALARMADEATVTRRCRSRLEKIMAECPLPTILLNRERVILELSARAEEELDQPRRRRGLLETLGSHELDEAAASAMDTQKPAELIVRLYAGGRRTYKVRLAPFRIEGEAECLVFLQDVAASMDFGELRSQFAATVSHELRTPLAGIRALVESLQDPSLSPEDAAKFLGRVDQETQRLGQLIDEILFLSSLESGSAENIAGKAMFGEAASRVLEKLEPLARQFEVSIDTRIQPDLSLPLSERMAGTLLSNLLENAIKYSGRGSHVELSAEKEGRQVRIVIRDDGIGIDAEHLPHIFERFYRVDKSRSRRLGGTGLGLSIVKHVVESAGGEVRANSREGFGTEMTILLPLRP
ncbi:MAG: GHKL domain-containing protein [Thermoleophilia bacterium]|nr:GHKL domain-containing protein [Thermoleophilia bacterium]